jgi:hypothetical protein
MSYGGMFELVYTASDQASCRCGQKVAVCRRHALVFTAASDSDSASVRAPAPAPASAPAPPPPPSAAGAAYGRRHTVYGRYPGADRRVLPVRAGAVSAGGAAGGAGLPAVPAGQGDGTLL